MPIEIFVEFIQLGLELCYILASVRVKFLKLVASFVEGGKLVLVPIFWFR